MYTENNHQSMRTVVETFIIEETQELIYDNEKLDQWNKHVEDLGLVGQTKIVKKEKSPIPFMHLKKSYKSICEELCPRKVTVEEYNISPIPVEVLDLIALSKKENYFHKIEIWYDDESLDPFCVGIIGGFIPRKQDGSWLWKDPCQTYNEALELCDEKLTPYFNEGTHYLIAKWADVKQSWEELKNRAIERFKAEARNDAAKKIKEANRELEDLETKAFDRFN